MAIPEEMSTSAPRFIAILAIRTAIGAWGRKTKQIICLAKFSSNLTVSAPCWDTLRIDVFIIKSHRIINIKHCNILFKKGLLVWFHGDPKFEGYIVMFRISHLNGLQYDLNTVLKTHSQDTVNSGGQKRWQKLLWLDTSQRRDLNRTTAL